MQFDINRPQSQYAINPDYAYGADARRLALLGYKPSGEQNTWGKVSSWIPGLGVGMNYAARGLTRQYGDTFSNVKEDTDNRWMKLGLEAAAATAAFGGAAALGAGAAGAGGLSGAVGSLGVAGGKEVLGQGLKAGLTFGGQLAFDQEGKRMTDDSSYYYL